MSDKTKMLADQKRTDETIARDLARRALQPKFDPRCWCGQTGNMAVHSKFRVDFYCEKHIPPDDPLPPLPKPSRDWKPATLASLQKNAPWLWIMCLNCGRREPRALTPYIIAYGPDVTGEEFARRLRCGFCNHRPLRLGVPGHEGVAPDITVQPFPVEHFHPEMSKPANEKRPATRR